MAEKSRIFLVEDHAGTARAFKMYLENHGYEVSVADSVAAALRHAKQERFDLLVCDIGLPDGTGWDLMKALSADRAVCGIAFTASCSTDDIERSRKVGFHKHVAKGSSADDLVLAIEEALNAKPNARKDKVSLSNGSVRATKKSSAG